MRRALVVAAVLTALGSPALAQAKFGTSGRWCGSSPEMRLSGVPKGTAKLDFRMTDLNAPSYPHGGGQLPYQGQNTIACSELSQKAGGYQGPSPPPGQVHTYQWTIRALDASGASVGQAVLQMKYPQ